MIPIPLDGRWTRQKAMGLLALFLAAISAFSALVAHREIRTYEPMYALPEPKRYPDREAQFLQRLRAQGNPEIVVGIVENLQGTAFYSEVSIIRQLKYQESMLSFGRAVFVALTLGLLVISAVLLMAPSPLTSHQKHAA